jgi:dihydropyrimidinase
MMTMTTLIKNGQVVTSTHTLSADILIEEEKIANIAPGIVAGPGMDLIDASGMYVLPGGIDAHVHLDLPMSGTVSSDDHYTGTKAAAFGGTTTVIDFVSQDSDDLLACIAALRQKADQRVAIDYGLHMNITHLTPGVETQIAQLPAVGVTSVKVFAAYNNRLRLIDSDILKVMRVAAQNGLLTLLHAENGDIIDLLVKEALSNGHTTPIWHARTRPAWGAVEAALRGAALSSIADAPLYLVHMNVAGEVDMLEYARHAGLKVMGETCPQYLFFSEAELVRADAAKWICSPPLRTEIDQQRLWEGLKAQTIQVIATDHCPFFFEGSTPITYEGVSIAIPGKELGDENFTRIPNGLPGVGDRLPVLWTAMVASGKFTMNEFVALTSTNPARIFGLYPRKGDLTPGADADIVIWDPNKQISYGTAYAQHRTDYNLYEGWELSGFPTRVISRGRTVVDNGNWHGRAGDGQFLQRETFSELP